MKVTYDVATDSLTVILNEQASIAESDEDKPGIILDYDKDGNLVSTEVLDASKRVTEANEGGCASLTTGGECAIFDWR